jgi:hypothetical protein
MYVNDVFVVYTLYHITQGDQVKDCGITGSCIADGRTGKMHK